GPLAADPQQPFVPIVDLIHQRQVFVPFAPGDLVDADRCNRAPFPVHDSPQNRMSNRPEYALPTGVEYGGHLLPGESLRPSRQEPAIRRRQTTSSVAPRHPLHLDPTPPAVHTACGTRHTPPVPTRQRTRSAAAPAGRTGARDGRS